MSTAAAALVLVVRGTDRAQPRWEGRSSGIALTSCYGLATRLFADRLGVVRSGCGVPAVRAARLLERPRDLRGDGVPAGDRLRRPCASIAVRALCRSAAPSCCCRPSTSRSDEGRGSRSALALAGRCRARSAPLAARRRAAGGREPRRRGRSRWPRGTRRCAWRTRPLAVAAGEGQRLALILVALAAVARRCGGRSRCWSDGSACRERVRLGFAAALLLASRGRPGGLRASRRADRHRRARLRRLQRAAAEPPGRRISASACSRSTAATASSSGSRPGSSYEANIRAGRGAGSYEQHWLADRPFEHKVRDAHSLYLETLSELGPVGLVLLLVALGAPLAAAVARPPAPAGAGRVRRLRRVPRPCGHRLGLGAACAHRRGADLRRSAARGRAPGGANARFSARWTRGAALAATLAVAAVAFVTLVGNIAVAASDSAAEDADWSEGRRRGSQGGALGALVVRAVAAAGRGTPGRGRLRRGRERLPRGDRARAARFRALARPGASDRRGRARRRARPRARQLNPFSPELEEFGAG